MFCSNAIPPPRRSLILADGFWGLVLHFWYPGLAKAVGDFQARGKRGSRGQFSPGVFEGKPTAMGLACAEDNLIPVAVGKSVRVVAD